MLTGEIRNQVDRVWDIFWSGGISNPLEVIEQITYLLFFKRLDEIHTGRENKANRLGVPIEEPIFGPDQITFVNYIIDHLTKNGTMEPALLYERPFTDIHYGGPDGVFSDDQANDLVKVLVSVNESVKM